jgi:hypothetical protein
MKKLIAALMFTFLAFSVHPACADVRIKWDERMVGHSHPTLSDTLNRFGMVGHNNDGTHKNVSNPSWLLSLGFNKLTGFPAACAAGQYVKSISASSLSCEVPIQIGTLTNLKWCTSDGTKINCASNAPVLTESDPKVGTLTNGNLCAGTGTQTSCTIAPTTYALSSRTINGLDLTTNRTLTLAHITSGTLGGTAVVPVARISGTLPIANGGTGVTDLTFSGNTTKAATVSGSTTANRYASWDASGNIVDSGYTIGTGAGGGASSLISLGGNGQQTNIAVGFNGTASTAPLGANTTGTNNIAIGQGALKSATTSYSNIAIGSNALSTITTSSGRTNIAIGMNALKLSTTGYSNVAIGEDALASNTTGSNNIAINGALPLNTTGEGNVSIGQSSLRANTSGSYNTAVGIFAGYASLGAGNIYLGSLAGMYETGSNKLFIDNQDRTDEAGGRANSLIYGIMDASPINQYLTVNGQLAVNGRISTTQTVAPTVSSCGTSPAVAGTDQVMKVTFGTGTPSACTITFNRAFPVAPNCVATHYSATPVVVGISAISTTALTINTNAAAASAVFGIMCF